MPSRDKFQHNGIDREIAKEDIVLGFQTEYRRKFTDYAVS
ncbi:MAG: XisI protein [Candidatus Magnetomorum sp.]|nr:XisI protein [Candidatus Magnetomorum sp.]